MHTKNYSEHRFRSPALNAVSWKQSPVNLGRIKVMSTTTFDVITVERLMRFLLQTSAEYPSPAGVLRSGKTAAHRNRAEMSNRRGETRSIG